MFTRTGTHTSTLKLQKVVKHWFCMKFSIWRLNYNTTPSNELQNYPIKWTSILVRDSYELWHIEHRIVSINPYSKQNLQQGITFVDVSVSWYARYCTFGGSARSWCRSVNFGTTALSVPLTPLASLSASNAVICSWPSGLQQNNKYNHNQFSTPQLNTSYELTIRFSIHRFCPSLTNHRRASCTTTLVLYFIQEFIFSLSWVFHVATSSCVPYALTHTPVWIATRSIA